MEYYLFIAGLLTGMLIGVLIMNRIYNSHSKETHEATEQEHIPYKSHYGVDYSKHDYPE